MCEHTLENCEILLCEQTYRYNLLPKHVDDNSLSHEWFALKNERKQNQWKAQIGKLTEKYPCWIKVYTSIQSTEVRTKTWMCQ